MKATAIANTMEGLVKYHGLKNWNLRLPYHDSISVNLDALWTKTTVEFKDYPHDMILINGNTISNKAFTRCQSILNVVRKLAKINLNAKITSTNNIKTGSAKGLGFSSSGGAALATAAFKAAGLDREFGWDLKLISRIARRLAGSACRSVIGEYSKWHAGSCDEDSYAVKIASKNDLDMTIIAVPLPSHMHTEDAHREVETSPFFQARVESAQKRIVYMEKAIQKGDLDSVGRMAEADSFELHSITMTGDKGILIYRPESIKVINEVRQMQMEKIPVYFSMQTGPSVFLNTYPEYADEVKHRIEEQHVSTIVSRIGGEARIITS